MSKSIHGHKVMNLLAAADKVLSKSELLEEIRRTFGYDAVYHTCSAEGLSAEDLIDFLLNKGKFIESDTGLTMPADNRCH
ncbi:DUF2492 domain-containing protein [Vibrio sp. HA2012]|uniref:YecH family metal-binding protein n=1 Tax=Vibrio sp. HA2012 TaxID=1971595 RepID=UPI000C2C81EC|nr:YecH family metal-binding protein [Vibrio sp. HA2012]PJC88206.1 DUF2492 domain-containing protein [Vibrio sp. HA2012]